MEQNIRMKEVKDDAQHSGSSFMTARTFMKSFFWMMNLN